MSSWAHRHRRRVPNRMKNCQRTTRDCLVERFLENRKLRWVSLEIRYTHWVLRSLTFGTVQGIAQLIDEQRLCRTLSIFIHINGGVVDKGIEVRISRCMTVRCHCRVVSVLLNILIMVVISMEIIYNKLLDLVLGLGKFTLTLWVAEQNRWTDVSRHLDKCTFYWDYGQGYRFCRSHCTPRRDSGMERFWTHTNAWKTMSHSKLDRHQHNKLLTVTLPQQCFAYQKLTSGIR